MKSRPILFSAPMVRALLDGSKSQTRRVVKPQPSFFGSMTNPNQPFKTLDAGLHCPIMCPYGQPGDRLWVRETWQHGAAFEVVESVSGEIDRERYYFRADQVPPYGITGRPWRPSIFMPRHISRITLEITSVRVERLQAISEADAIAEGAEEYRLPLHPAIGPYKAGYSNLWGTINAKRAPWASNPWVWVVSFKGVAS